MMKHENNRNQTLPNPGKYPHNRNAQIMPPNNENTQKEKKKIRLVSELLREKKKKTTRPHHAGRFRRSA